MSAKIDEIKEILTSLRVGFRQDYVHIFHHEELIMHLYFVISRFLVINVNPGRVFLYYINKKLFLLILAHLFSMNILLMVFNQKLYL